MTADPWASGFAKFLDAAAPYLDQLVIAGGWASRLHRLSPHADPPTFEALGTKDVDAAAPASLPLADQPLDVRLKHRGFEEKLSSEFRPPVTHYVLGEPEGFEVEFLTDQPGAYEHRDGTPDRTAEIAGVTAQKLHYVGLLLVEPWPVSIRQRDGFPMEVRSRVVRIANPFSYIVQKLLIRPDREQDKREKDVLYIHDTLQLFADAGAPLELAASAVRAQMQRRWVERCRTAAEKLSKPAHPDVVAATRIALETGRATDEEAVAAVLRLGLSTILAAP